MQSNQQREPAMLKPYVSPEVRRLLAQRDYHTACAQQYRDAAKKIMMSDAFKQRALDNATFHDNKLAEVNAALARKGA
jgi:hypothetical protein